MPVWLWPVELFIYREKALGLWNACKENLQSSKHLIFSDEYSFTYAQIMHAFEVQP